jgi:anti-sigma B factor antagonist
MSIKERMVGDITVVEVKGNLMGGKETNECHDKVKELIEGGNKKLVIDLSNVKWMNSKGLGMLMACYTSCQNSDANLKLAGATDKVNSLFMMTKLMTIFDTHENADRAIGSFTG